MNNIKQRQLHVLEDTCNHFNINNRSVKNTRCVYGGVGCAIGRLIENKSLCEFLDTCAPSTISNKNVFEKIPESLQELGIEFLRELQLLHDDSANWYIAGLNDRGLASRINIIKNFQLPVDFL